MSLKNADYPDAIDPDLVGSYPASAKAGGGYVWDVVLEYRVWCHPERGASDPEDGSDYYYAFATYEEALAFSHATAGAEAGRMFPQSRADPLIPAQNLSELPEPPVSLHSSTPMLR